MAQARNDSPSGDSRLRNPAPGAASLARILSWGRHWTVGIFSRLHLGTGVCTHRRVSLRVQWITTTIPRAQVKKSGVKGAWFSCAWVRVSSDKYSRCAIRNDGQMTGIVRLPCAPLKPGSGQRVLDQYGSARDWLLRPCKPPIGLDVRVIAYASIGTKGEPSRSPMPLSVWPERPSVAP